MTKIIVIRIMYKFYLWLPQMQALPEVMAARHANEALQVQMAQLRAQLAEVNRQNNDLRTQNRELSWQVQQLQLQQRPPLRATSSEDSPSPRRQVCWWVTCLQVRVLQEQSLYG